MSSGTVTTNDRAAALAALVDCDISNVTADGANSFSVGDREFFVLTDEEADQYARERIEDDLWAFRASFIAQHSRVELDDAAIKALEDMQGRMCESANPIVRAMIRDLDAFVEAAIDADGRGHFIGPYDGQERETEYGGRTFYVYRY